MSKPKTRNNSAAGACLLPGGGNCRVSRLWAGWHGGGGDDDDDDDGGGGGGDEDDDGDDDHDDHVDGDDDDECTCDNSSCVIPSRAKEDLVRMLNDATGFHPKFQN